MPLSMWIVCGLAPAWADAPHFEAAHPEDARTAALAWDAAESCAGWSGPHHAHVDILRGALRGGYRGLAFSDEAGLYRIEIDESDPHRRAEVIVHEVAHAWVSEGPPALVEGRTELLADCIVSRRPGLAPLQWDDGRALTDLPPDLRAWRYTEDHGPARANQRTDAYLAASRLIRVAALLVPERALWPQTPMGWAEFDVLLQAAGEPGRTLLARLDGGSAALAGALSDTDRDGLARITEELVRSDPDRWDSDADGWWDGAVLGIPPARSVAMPIDGTPVCSGLAGSPHGGEARVSTGGNLRGTDLPEPLLVTSAGLARSTRVAPGAPVVVDLARDLGEASGGLWADVRGSGLVPDRTCANTQRHSIWATDPALSDLASAFSDLVQEAAGSADARWGPMPGRFAVQLGGERTLFEDDVVYLSTAEVERAVRRGELRELATVAAMVPRSWRNGERDWRIAEALARALQR